MATAARLAPSVSAQLPGYRLDGESVMGILACMVDDTARERAIYQALKATDEVAAALQAHLVEEHAADPERTAARTTSTDSMDLLRQARERLGEGLRAVEADNIALSDEISLRRGAGDRRHQQ
jgi:hypothetical protein